MSKEFKSLMVIPARGGSKRLPRKNVLGLGGKPLIAHTIEAALGTQCFSSVLVSTDDEEIADIARGYDGVSLDFRDPALAGDRTKVVDVISDICNRPDIQSRFAVIGMMLPTAPFRRGQSVREAMVRLTSDTDAVVSFAPYDFPPKMAVTLDEGQMTMKPIFDDSPLITGDTRSQDHEPAYRPNGSLYLSWMSSFLKYKSFFKGRVKGVVMTRLSSVDIDTQTDMTLARLLIQSNQADSDFL